MIDFSDASRLAKHLFAMLGQALSSRDHGFRLPSLATLGEGRFPECRLVVLRHVDEALRAIHVHTDVRSPKIAQLQADPRLTLLFYDPVTRVQIRCRTSATIHIEDDIARAAWLALAPASRTMYAAVESPSDIVPDHPPMPATPDENDPAAFRHFAVIACSLTEIDVLELGQGQNRRALLRWTGQRWEMSRLAA